MNHWVFLPPTNFEDLSSPEKHQVMWLTKDYHSFDWNFGFEKYENSKKLIQDALHDIDFIYVQGGRKPAWLNLFI